MSEYHETNCLQHEKIANVEASDKGANHERLKEKFKRVQGPVNFTTERMKNAIYRQLVH